MPQIDDIYKDTYWVPKLVNNYIPCQCNRCKPKGIAPPAMPEYAVGVMPVSEIPPSWDFEIPSNWDIEEDPEID